MRRLATLCKCEHVFDSAPRLCFVLFEVDYTDLLPLVPYRPADMSDMILSLHFVYSPAILLYIINNIMLLKRSIIAKSTVCADIFNNMLHRPLYSLLRTKGVESKEHLLRIRVQAYSMIICLRSLLCNTTALRMWIGLFSTCNVSAHAGLTSSLGHCIWTYLLMVLCTSRS